MAFIETIKRLFGLGEAPAGGQPTPDNLPPPLPVSAPAALSLPPAAQKRDALVRFIVEKLSPYTNEVDNAPTGLRLWVRCDSPAEEELMAVALYANQPGQFQSELNRHLANQYIYVSPDWQFDWQLVRDELPANCTHRQGNFGLTLRHRSVVTDVALQGRAQVRVLIGQTAEAIYQLDPVVKLDYCIGRGAMVQTATGRVRTNDIVFVDGDDPLFDPERGDPNLTVSRQHATIRYDVAHRRYRLYADAGGLTANGNKTKILRANDTIERVDIPGVGYVLEAGDQIELGGDAKLLIEST